MQKQNLQEHSSQISWSISSAVLLTAAHSGKLNRGGPLYNEKLRVHLREKYTSTLALRWAYQIQQILSGNQINAASFCIWSMQHKFNQFDIDPNYLTDSNLHLSHFHQYLHNFQNKFKGQPMLHIDIHGKKNRKDNYELDLGMECLFKHFDNDQQILELKQFFENNFNKFLSSFPKMNGYTAKLNSDPYLSGNWGGKIYTMNEQACMMSIPSIQLEIPKRMRKYIFENYEVSKQFCQILVDAYKLVFQWKIQKKLLCLCKVNDLQVSSLGHQEVVQMEKKYVIWENKLSKEKKENTI